MGFRIEDAKTFPHGVEDKLPEAENKGTEFHQGILKGRTVGEQ